MIALVTGGAGFIGSHLVRGLLEQGQTVRVLDNLSTGTLDSLDALEGVDARIGDIRDDLVVRGAMEGVEVVYHLAALPSVARSVDDPEASHSVNDRGTLTVLMAAREAAVRRVVNASSSSVYGNTPTLPKHEGMVPSVRSPYAASKLAGEAYCRAFASVYGLETVSLRFFNVFGPRQDPTSEYAAVIPRFVTRVLEEEAPVIFGDGSQSRDFTYVANAVDACLLAANAGSDAVGMAINVGCGSRTTLLEVIQLLEELSGKPVSPVFQSARPGDVKHSQASIEEAERLIGYQPRYSFREGLAETLAWYSGGQRRAAENALVKSDSLIDGGG